MPNAPTQLFDDLGRRKYLTDGERKRFFEATKLLDLERQLFCQILLNTGCRISEALQLTRERVDPEIGAIIFKTLKRRDDSEQRAVPISSLLLKALRESGDKRNKRIFSFCRGTGWRAVKQAMTQARIDGLHACPKGLRHGFGISCVENSIPITQISKWMGHSNIKTTSIYTNALGREERRLARRVWVK